MMNRLFWNALRRSLQGLSDLHVRLIIEGGLRSEAIRYLRNPSPEHSVSILRSFGAEIGEGTTIKRTLFLDNVSRDKNSTGDFSRLEIGGDCYIGDRVYFDLANDIVLEDASILSGGVSIVTHADCNRSPLLREHFQRTCAPVHVGREAWIGFGTTLLNGVRIGEGAVVGAHSLVNENVEAHCLYAGTPAHKIRALNT